MDILISFGPFLQVLVCCAWKSLATLLFKLLKEKRKRERERLTWIQALTKSWQGQALKKISPRLSRDRCYDFLKYFRQKIAFFAQTTASFLHHNNGFWRKTPIFCIENCQKSQKILIITSAPAFPPLLSFFSAPQPANPDLNRVVRL
jgi:hypothetical protein